MRLAKALSFTGGDKRLELYASQAGLCAICGKEPEDRRLAMDHCHATGRVRGLLCMHCNVGLGMFKDNKEVLEKAIAYLCK